MISHEDATTVANTLLHNYGQGGVITREIISEAIRDYLGDEYFPSRSDVETVRARITKKIQEDRDSA